MASAQSPQVLVISGATGWLGREALERLEAENVNGPALHVIPISSKVQTLDLESGKKLTTQTFDNLILPEKVEGFIHLAFLTREKVAQLGQEEFILRNLQLISHACQVIERSKPKWIILVSSGAIFKSKSNELENDILVNPYGFLKRIEELLIEDAATRVGANVVIGRLWGATGRHMPLNRAYAVSDLMAQAQAGGPIQIHSRHQVFRRYCDAGEFMDLLIRLAKNGESLTLDSGGPLIEVGELASQIASRFPHVIVQRGDVTNDPADEYYPRSQDYEKAAEKVGVDLSSVAEQIDRTCAGHMSQFKA
jgi:nucleoside-diphosphate-sugar epimerase